MRTFLASSSPLSSSCCALRFFFGGFCAERRNAQKKVLVDEKEEGGEGQEGRSRAGSLDHVHHTRRRHQIFVRALVGAPQTFLVSSVGFR